jgi:hypothetical protein
VARSTQLNFSVRTPEIKSNIVDRMSEVNQSS